ncbi:DUF6308 family protein [Streptomyces viridochromogenes]|uniref:DUF6308 family protein n=1 Tax=Streptomyces viridochromogenes TaxID=1938 RepID=UPI0031E02B69
MLPDPQPLANRLHCLLTSAQADEDLRRYFGIGQPSGAALFTGRRFEHLAGGGDRPAVDNIVTADDLIAVQTLSVMIPAQGALDLLEGRLGVQLSELLHEIPNHMDMADADASALAPGSPADAAWHLLTDQPGIGWVTAGKILARKRPRLLPVYDQVVRCVLGRPTSFWLDLHSALRAGDRALHHELLALRRSAKVPETVSALRICDVVLWMRHHVEHRAANCIGPGHQSAGSD